MGLRESSSSAKRASMHADPHNFENLINSIDPKELDRGLVDTFSQRLRANRKKGGGNSFYQRFLRLCEVFHRHDAEVSSVDRIERTRLVGALREELAMACLYALQPDLIILDEFQRFKHLLDPDREESRLAQSLFKYPKAKTVLVSA